MAVKHVYLSAKPVRARLEPKFIIKVDGVYWVTKAVWGYDLALAGDDEDKVQGCNDIKNEFDTLAQAGPTYTAVKRDEGASGGDGNQTSD